MKTDNAKMCLSRFVKLLNIDVTSSSIHDELEKHPDHPSFLAFSDVLYNWQVPNGSLQIDAKELNTISTPFIAHLSINGGEFAIVNSIDGDYISFVNVKQGKYKMTLEEFGKLYSGFILVAEPDRKIVEHNYHQKRRKEIVESLRFPFVIAALVIITSLLFIQSPFLELFKWQTVFLAFAKSIGLVVSILLLIQSIDSNNPLIQRLCASSEKVDCNAILSSKAAKLTEEISWSEIGFFYFSGTWLALLFNSAHLNMMQILSLINMIALPYTFYSIYYQYRVAKRWCILCCTVQVLLWIEFIAFIPFWRQAMQIPYKSEIFMLLTCFLMPIILWVFIKPYLLKEQQLSSMKRQLKRFKFNAVFFKKVLTEQLRYSPMDAMHTVAFGNEDSKHIITVVSNPYCPPCAKVHQFLEEWIVKKNDIQLRVIFHADQSESKAVAQHIMSLNKIDKNVAMKAVSSWYSQEIKDYNLWKKMYSIDTDRIDNMSLQIQREWCDMVNIAFTPTIFIDGYRLPKQYSVEDIKYLL